MFTNLAPGAVGISGVNLQQTIDLARQNGFGGIDLPLGEVAAMEDPMQARAMIDQAGLRWGGFGLPVDFRRDEKTFEEGLALLNNWAPVSAKVGCTRCATWLLPFHDELDYRTNFDLHQRRLKLVNDVLASHGIGLGLEFVGPSTLRRGHKHEFIHTADQLLELADAIDPANCGLLLDCWHWYTSHGTVDDITGKMRNRVVYVHVNDAPTGRSIDEQIDNDRRLPASTGVIDIKAFLNALAAIHYDGPITAEPFMPELSQLPADQTAARVAAAMKKMMSLI